MYPSKIHNRLPRLRFSLRSLLILTALVAAAAGIVGRRIHQVRHREQHRRRDPAAGGLRPIRRARPAPQWLVRLLGEDFFADLYLVESDSPSVDDQMLAQLAKLPRLEWLVLDSDRITDRGLRQLAALDGLRRG